MRHKIPRPGFVQKQIQMLMLTWVSTQNTDNIWSDLKMMTTSRVILSSFCVNCCVLFEKDNHSASSSLLNSGRDDDVVHCHKLSAYKHVLTSSPLPNAHLSCKDKRKHGDETVELNIVSLMPIYEVMDVHVVDDRSTLYISGCP